MSKYTDLAAARRREMNSEGRPVYNCAQTVVSVFAKDAGYDEAACLRCATFFRGGMQMGSVCGAVTGGLMALGLSGVTDPAAAAALEQAVRDSHDGAIDCAQLLKANAEKGGEKLPFCNSVIAQCVSCVEEILTRQGKL